MALLKTLFSQYRLDLDDTIGKMSNNSPSVDVIPTSDAFNCVNPGLLWHPSSSKSVGGAKGVSSETLFNSKLIHYGITFHLHSWLRNNLRSSLFHVVLIHSSTGQKSLSLSFHFIEDKSQLYTFSSPRTSQEHKLLTNAYDSSIFQ